MANVNPTFFGDGHTPRITDPLWVINQKILGALNDIAGGGGGGGAMQRLSGHGDPNGVVTGSVGDIYLNLDSGSETPKMSGNGTNTGWNYIG